MSSVEARHWWYQGLRGFLDVVFDKFSNRIGSEPKVLDAGCGTGANLLHINKKLSPSHLEGFDFSEEAVRFTREKTSFEHVYQGDICNPSLLNDEYDLITSMDVIYIPGAEAALPGLKKLVGCLKQEGLLVLNLPAYNWLYSEHDVAIHTKERYTLGRVKKIFDELGLKMLLGTYRVHFLFPLICLARLPSMIKKPKESEAQSDLTIPAGLTNSFFLKTLQLENSLLHRGLSFPFGSSVSVVGVKSK